MTKFLAVGVVAFFATAAMAQTTFYVVQDTKTKRCTVVREKPTTKTTVMVGPAGTVYKTETEAQTAMRKIKVCETR
ncbi:MAG: hypothetical protein ACRECO_18460 [Xanthobacteraceae bacterium]